MSIQEAEKPKDIICERVCVTKEDFAGENTVHYDKLNVNHPRSQNTESRKTITHILFWKYITKLTMEDGNSSAKYREKASRRG